MKLFDKLFPPRYNTPEEIILVLRARGRMLAKEAASAKKLSRLHFAQARLFEQKVANERRQRHVRDRKAANSNADTGTNRNNENVER